MRRRDFITLIGGAVTWPLVAQAQQGQRMRRVGALLPANADDPDYRSWVGAFQQRDLFCCHAIRCVRV